MGCFSSMKCIKQNTLGNPFEMIQQDEFNLRINGILTDCTHLSHLLVKETDNLLRMKRSFALQHDFTTGEFNLATYSANMF